MPDGPDNENSGSDLVPTPPAEPEYPVDRLKARIGGVFAGRPLAVYLVLIAGAATLVILLIIVWISATGTTNEEHPICTTVSTSDARNAILAGQVKRVDVLVDADSPSNTLTGINLNLADGSCRSTAQGADVRNDLYLVLGVVDFYNNFAENRIRVNYQKQTIQPELLSTSTPTPTATPPPTETRIPPTASPTPLPTRTATAAPTRQPEPSATPFAAATPSAAATLQPTRRPTEPPATATAATRFVPSRTAESTIQPGL